MLFAQVYRFTLESAAHKRSNKLDIWMMDVPLEKIVLLEMAPKSPRHIELQCTVAQVGEYRLHMLQNANMVTITIVDAAVVVHAV